MRGGGIQGGGIPLEILKNQVVAPRLNPLPESIYAGREILYEVERRYLLVRKSFS